jgi:hypothetical protein
MTVWLENLRRSWHEETIIEKARGIAVYAIAAACLAAIILAAVSHS